MERLVRGLVGDDHAVPERLEIALQVRQRGPQLVGGVGDEVAPHPLLLLEAGRHLVERIGERGDLLRAFAGHARRVVALGDPARRGPDLAERPGEHPAHHERDADARERGDDHRRDHDGRDRLVVHRPGVLGGVARLDHQLGEGLAADDDTPTTTISSPIAAAARAASAIRIAIPRELTASRPGAER